MKRKGIRFAAVFFPMLFLWILLSGTDPEEVLAGCMASAIVASLTYKLFEWDRSYPRRLLWLLRYVPYYAYAEVLSHVQVISMIFTGRIRPSIVEVQNPHKSDYGTTALANSITMTPGTITLEMGKDKLYIHCLNLKGDKRSITSGFERYLGKVWP